MFAILYALGMAVADLVKSRARLEAEILLLRHQLNLALRHAPPWFDCTVVIAPLWFEWFGYGRACLVWSS
jgi:hypothetical protein